MRAIISLIVDTLLLPGITFATPTLNGHYEKNISFDGDWYLGIYDTGLQ